MQDEAILVQACQKGDNSSFGELYDKYIQSIYKFIYFKTHHKETAEDLTGTVFIKALESINSYHLDKGSFSVWLYRIARNTVIDYYRTKKTNLNIEDAWGVSDNKDLLKDVDINMKMEGVRIHMKGLNPIQREIVIMRIWNGMSYKEISEVLKKSEVNCRMIYLRGIKSLREKIPVAVYLFLLFGYLK